MKTEKGLLSKRELLEIFDLLRYFGSTTRYKRNEEY